MKRPLLIAILRLFAVQLILSGLGMPLGARSDFQIFQAVAVVGGSTPLTITADPLPNQAFFGKSVAVPIEVSSLAPLSTRNLTIEIVYQALDANGNALSTMSGIPVQAILHPTKQNTLSGMAIVPRSDLLGIARGGHLRYFFRASQNGAATMLTKGGISRAPASSPQASGPSDPFEVTIIDTLRVPVGPQGASVKVPDLVAHDGRTAINFEAGALANPGVLVVHQEDVNGWAAGPKGLSPVEVFSFNLEGTSLQRSAQLTFSYPADLKTGKLSDTNANPMDLAPYWWDSFEWRLLSKPTIDTTLHTVMAPTNHFSTFALFATGAAASADLRPRERIITPNGDNVNDVACFGSDLDEVRIFDIRGRRIRTIPGSTLMTGQSCGTFWDGKDESGKIVESGVYVYQFTIQGERISGVISVAK